MIFFSLMIFFLFLFTYCIRQHVFHCVHLDMIAYSSGLLVKLYFSAPKTNILCFSFTFHQFFIYHITINKEKKLCIDLYQEPEGYVKLRARETDEKTHWGWDGRAGSSTAGQYRSSVMRIMCPILVPGKYHPVIPHTSAPSLILSRYWIFVDLCLAQITNMNVP